MSDDKLDFSKAPNVFLFIANIMDYFRVIFCVYAFYYSKTNPVIFLILYFIAFVLLVCGVRQFDYGNSDGQFSAKVN